MNWFFIALIGPILWSVVNHVDKFILSKYFKSEGVGGLMLFSSLFGLVVLPFIALFQPHVLSINIFHACILVILGFILAITILLYLYALDMDEASIVIPFYQIIPVFGFILGYLILGEIISKIQILGSVILMCGALVLSLEFYEEKKIKFKAKLIGLLLVATFLIAFSEVIFKLLTVPDAFWVSIFWQNVGLGLSGVFLFVFMKSYRNQFLNVIKSNKLGIISLNTASESLSMIAGFSFSYATLLAPIALVLLVNAYQPLFVFIGGILLTVFLPHIATEKISTIHFIQKILAIAIVILGSYMIQ